MSKKPEPTPVQPKTAILSFVFNSPTLVPWSVVKDFQDDPVALADKVDTWQSAYIPGYRFKESESVCECSNPTLKMTIKRILREKDKTGDKNEKGEFKQRLIGFECYWFVTIEEASAQAALMSIRANRRVPVPIEE
jgi:hypothetical protein